MISNTVLIGVAVLLAGWMVGYLACIGGMLMEAKENGCKLYPETVFYSIVVFAFGWPLFAGYYITLSWRKDIK